MSLPLTAVVVCSRVQQVRVDRIDKASPCLSFTLTFCLPVWCLSIHIYLSIWVAAVHVHVHCRSQFGSSNRLLSLSLSLSPAVACCLRSAAYAYAYEVCGVPVSHSILPHHLLPIPAPRKQNSLASPPRFSSLARSPILLSFFLSFFFFFQFCF